MRTQSRSATDCIQAVVLFILGDLIRDVFACQATSLILHSCKPRSLERTYLALKLLICHRPKHDKAPFTLLLGALPDVLQHQRVHLPLELLNATFSGIFQTPATMVPNSLACKAIKKLLLHSIKTARCLSIVTFMNTSRFANEKEMQIPTQERQQLSQTNNSSVKPL